MILAIDAGNSNITIGAYAPGSDAPAFTARLQTSRRMTSDQYAIALSHLAELYGYGGQGFTDCIIGSVVSELTAVLAKAAALITGVQPLVLAPGVKTGLDIRIDNPAQLGADLIAAAVGAKNAYPMPCLIIDLGTATKISALGCRGEFLGCMIAPGIGISLDALAGEASLLPHISLEAPEKAIGTNTVASMRSGIVYGTAAMLDGMTDRMEQELPQPAAALLGTGGYAEAILPHCRRDVILCNDLILSGLRSILLKNR
ncbi:MAG: type III pantothenate kinase [Oscillospiraceae bacterium]|nr:type III pantothenate kinase [Oscillospiraceae bacterium]